MSDVQREAFNLLALRRAAAVAAASSASMIQKNPHLPVRDFVRLSRQRIELDQCLHAAEDAFLDKLAFEMHQDEMVRSVFDLLDVDGSGTLSVWELAEGIRRMNDLNAIAEVMPLAEKAMSTYVDNNTTANTGEQGMGVQQLGEFLKRLAQTMGCTFLELTQLIVAKVAFGDSGRVLLEQAVMALDDQANDSIGRFDDAVVEARLILVYDILDDEHKGTIPLKEVVKHLFRFTEAMKKDQRQVLLMANDQKQIDFAEFVELILNVVAFSEGSRFHEIADAMTLSACRQDVTDNDIRELLLSPGLYKNALEDGIDRDEEEKECDHDLTNGKLHRLFDMWDLDHNGALDVSEFATGMRKFQDMQDIGATVDTTLDALQSCDEDNDNLLNRKEFAILLRRLATSTRVDLHRLIDFMVVQTALKDVSDKEQAYLETFKKLRARDYNQKRSDSHRGSFAGLLKRALSGEPETVVETDDEDDDEEDDDEYRTSVGSNLNEGSNR